MNEEEADIIFKIQEKTIPAHKTILTQKSRYFTNLFKSNFFSLFNMPKIFIQVVCQNQDNK